MWKLTGILLTQFVWSVKSAIAFLLVNIVSIIQKNKWSVPHEGVRYLLVNPESLGDVVLLSWLVARLKRGEHTDRIGVVVESQYAELVGSSGADSVFVIGDHSLHTIVRLLKDLRSHRYDVAINTLLPRSPLSDVVVLLCGAQETIAFEGDGLFLKDPFRQWLNGSYSTLIPLRGDHVLDHYDRLLLAAEVDNGIDREKSTALPFQIPPEVRTAVAQMMEPWKLKHGTTLLAVAPGASTRLKKWPVEKYRALLRSFNGDNIAAVLIGSRDERGELEAIGKDSTVPTYNTAGELTLIQVMALLDRCDAVLGNDTGILHLAAALKKPSLVIMAGGEPGRFFPYGTARVVRRPVPCEGCRWLCPYAEPHCISEIDVEAVRRALMDVLEAIPHKDISSPIVGGRSG